MRSFNKRNMVNTEWKDVFWAQDSSIWSKYRTLQKDKPEQTI